MGGRVSKATTVGTDAYHSDPKSHEYLERLYPIIAAEGDVFLQLYCDIRPGAFVEWTTLLAAFDAYMVRKSKLYVEAKQYDPRVRSFLFENGVLFQTGDANKNKHNLTRHYLSDTTTPDVVSGIALLKFIE